MFRKNKKHQQPSLISNVQQLPERQKQRLEASWAGNFYREVFRRLDEGAFSILYSEIPSRPNVPVNILVGLEYLKAGMGWSDEELYDAFLYNIQVRYALGITELGESEFDLRTLYYFRERLNRHIVEKGENLLSKAFEQVTDEQVAAFKLKTGMQRMDTTQVASNIRDWGRIQLLVGVLQRVYRMLDESEQGQYQEDFQPYVREHSCHYMYRLKKEEHLEHLQRIGDFMQRMLVELAGKYEQEAVYQMLKRVFGEHYRMEAQKVKGVEDKDLTCHRLLSPDDFDATIRSRRGSEYHGYVANLSETYDPENSFQLITKIQVDSNQVDDPKLLLEALPNLQQRTTLETLYTDGGFGSFEVDQALVRGQIELVASAIRGRQPNPDRLSLADFAFELNENRIPTRISCPQGQAVEVSLRPFDKGYLAHFDLGICAQCPFAQSNRCPTHVANRHRQGFLSFTPKEFSAAKRRQQVRALTKTDRNLRAAIEATCRALKCRFPKGRFPVRGKFRMSCMLVGSAVLNNLRRINRFLLATG